MERLLKVLTPCPTPRRSDSVGLRLRLRDLCFSKVSQVILVQF